MARQGRAAPRASSETQQDTQLALKKVDESGAAKVKVAATDIDGVLRGKYLNKAKFTSAIEGGFGFCDVVFGWDMTDSVYDNTTVTGWQHGFPDAMVRLDLATVRHVPWDDHVPFFLGDFVTGNGDPYPVCPRQTLKRVLKRAEKLGSSPCAGSSSNGSTSPKHRTAGRRRRGSIRHR